MMALVLVDQRNQNALKFTIPGCLAANSLSMMAEKKHVKQTILAKGWLNY